VNRGLIAKAFRETWAATLLFGLALFVVEMALSFVLPRFQKQLSDQWLQVAFIQSIIKAMVGADLSGSAGPEIFTSIPWVHPVVLAVTWAHAIVFCTRIPAGEVDRGTVDILMSMPVTRWRIHLSETVAWLASAAAIFAMATIGNALGSALADAPWQPARIGIVLANLALLYLGVGAFAWLLAALSDRRGGAVAAAFIIVVGSFLLNYLAQFWKPLEHVVFLSLVRYYRPFQVLRDGAWPLRDMAVLTVLAAGLWAAAGAVFARRDLTTV